MLKLPLSFGVEYGIVRIQSWHTVVVKAVRQHQIGHGPTDCQPVLSLSAGRRIEGSKAISSAPAGARAGKLQGSDHPYSEFILDGPNPHGSTCLMSARAWVPGHSSYLELGWCLCLGLLWQGL